MRSVFLNDLAQLSLSKLPLDDLGIVYDLYDLNLNNKPRICQVDCFGELSNRKDSIEVTYVHGSV